MRIITVAAVLVLATACGTNNYDNGEQRTVIVPELDWSQAARETGEDDWFGENYQQMNVATQMKGKLPRVGTFDGEGYGTISRDQWDGGEYVNLTLNTLDEDGWGMIGLGLEIDPETHEATYWTNSVIGCAGPEENDTSDFDESAEEAQLVVEEIEIDGEKFVKFELIGDFDGDSEVIGVAVVPAAE